MEGPTAEPLGGGAGPSLIVACCGWRAGAVSGLRQEGLGRGGRCRAMQRNAAQCKGQPHSRLLPRWSGRAGAGGRRVPALLAPAGPPRLFAREPRALAARRLAGCGLADARVAAHRPAPPRKPPRARHQRRFGLLLTGAARGPEGSQVKISHLHSSVIALPGTGGAPLAMPCRRGRLHGAAGRGAASTSQRVAALPSPSPPAAKHGSVGYDTLRGRRCSATAPDYTASDAIFATLFPHCAPFHLPPPARQRGVGRQQVTPPWFLHGLRGALRLWLWRTEAPGAWFTARRRLPDSQMTTWPIRRARFDFPCQDSHRYAQ